MIPPNITPFSIIRTGLSMHGQPGQSWEEDMTALCLCVSYLSSYPLKLVTVPGPPPCPGNRTDPPNPFPLQAYIPQACNSLPEPFTQMLAMCYVIFKFCLLFYDEVKRNGGLCLTLQLERFMLLPCIVSIDLKGICIVILELSLMTQSQGRKFPMLSFLGS